MSTRKILALIGSPRAKSTSGKLAKHLLDGLAAQGWTTEVQQFSRALRSPERWAELEEHYRTADVIVLCTPLYVDSLPADTTLGLERLTAASHTGKEQRMLAMVNCGFLEAEQNDTALEICRLFARDAGLSWLGGLAIGGGGALDGRSLMETGSMVSHIIRALDLCITAIDAGEPLPQEALTLIRRRFCPTWLYMLLANFGMLQGGHKHGKLMSINAKPYAMKK